MSEVIEEQRRQESASAHTFSRSVAETPIRRQQSERRLSSLVLALLSPYVALNEGYVQKTFLAIVILDIPLQIGTHLFYRETAAEFGALAGLSVSATTVALFALYTSWLMRALAGRNHEGRPSTKLNLPALFYLGLTALSVVVARDIGLSFFELFLLVQMYLVFLYVANFVRTRNDVLFVVSFLLIGCLIESALILALRFANLDSGLWGPIHIRVDTVVNGGLTRVGGTVGSPNEAGAYLSLVLAVAVSLLFTSVERKYKWLAAAALGFGSAALVFTFSRGAWISLIVAIGLFCLSQWRRHGASLKLPMAIAAILLMSYLPFRNAIEDRLVADDNGSAESRIPLMNLALRIIADNPVLGVGSNNFSTAMDDYLTPEFRRGFLYTVHNKYLLVWAETGIGGVLAYLAFLFGALRIGWACWKENDHTLSTLALGLTAGIVGHMIHQSVDIFHDRALTQILWLSAGLLVAMHGIVRTQLASWDQLSSIT